MIDGAYLEAIFVSSDETRLLPSISGGSSSHDGCLNEDAGSSVGVRPFLDGYGGEGDGILIILSQMEVSGEPGLDAPMFSDQFDELSAFLVIGMVEPAAAVDHMIFLQNT
mmetsp:Transcript_9952/g.14081  ORF Transcript_9952/g.14081 Transcript_9952/m.14081 type:complete len:110 (+) Transcript_9952:912-1241(+)